MWEGVRYWKGEVSLRVGGAKGRMGIFLGWNFIEGHGGGCVWFWARQGCWGLRGVDALVFGGWRE